MFFSFEAKMENVLLIGEEWWSSFLHLFEYL